MSWGKIDDGFATHPKVAPLSAEALQLWIRCFCWCHLKVNEGLRPGVDGFVPRALLATIGAGVIRKLEKLARELVDARAGGTFRFGLWEPVEGGWVFHDWKNYLRQCGAAELVPGPETPQRDRSEAGRIAGLASANARRARDGTAQPRSNDRPNDSRTTLVRPPERFPERLSNDVRPNDPERPRTTFEPPDPDPDPREDLSSLPVRSPARDRFAETFRADPPALREDVLRVWQAFKVALGYPPKTKFRGPHDEDARRIADAIDAYDEATCLGVVAVAPADDMVNGTGDERGQAHKTPLYIFENANTFNRLLAASERARAERQPSALEAVRRARSAVPDQGAP